MGRVLPQTVRLRGVGAPLEDWWRTELEEALCRAAANNPKGVTLAQSEEQPRQTHGDLRITFELDAAAKKELHGLNLAPSQ